MSFATDRDLLTAEPGLFIDVPLVSQQTLSVNDAQLSVTILTSASGNFADANVQPGAVVLLAEQPLEVIDRTDEHTLTVSRLRNKSTDTAIPPGDVSDAALIVRTFKPQIEQVHDQLVRLVGIDPDTPETGLTAASIVSRSVMVRLETLGALARIFAGAVAISGDNGELWRKAHEYHRQFSRALDRSKVLIDLDGDGRGDIHRHFAVTTWRRV